MMRRVVLVLAACLCLTGCAAEAAAPSRMRDVVFETARPRILVLGPVEREMAFARRLLDEMMDEARAPSRPFFVGNSLTEGMRLNSDDGFDFCCEVGISLRELRKKLVLPEGFDCAVIEMGSNELGVYTPGEFVGEYAGLIRDLGVECFCLSIPPVNEAKSRYAARVNNENVKKYNDCVREACEATGAVFVDCSPFFGDELNPDWTGDGLHLTPEVYADWYAFVLDAIGVRDSNKSDI